MKRVFSNEKKKRFISRQILYLKVFAKLILCSIGEMIFEKAFM